MSVSSEEKTRKKRARGKGGVLIEIGGLLFVRSIHYFIAIKVVLVVFGGVEHVENLLITM